jgi:hypothetical protein
VKPEDEIELDDGLDVMRGIFNCALLVSHLLSWCAIFYLLVA